MLDGSIASPDAAAGVLAGFAAGGCGFEAVCLAFGTTWGGGNSAGYDFATGGAMASGGADVRLALALDLDLASGGAIASGGADVCFALALALDFGSGAALAFAFCLSHFPWFHPHGPGQVDNQDRNCLSAPEPEH